MFVKLCTLFDALDVVQPADRLEPFQRTTMLLGTINGKDDDKYSILPTRTEQNEEKLSMTGKRRYLGKAKGPLLKFAGL